jgi:ankyrin repeat protein
MEAVNDGLTDFVKLLLDAGADPNIPTLEVYLCLHLSVCYIVCFRLFMFN